MTKLNLGSLFFFLIRLPFSFNTPLILQEIVVVVLPRLRNSCYDVSRIW